MRLHGFSRNADERRPHSPGRIEEVVDKAQKQVEKDVVRAGEDAAREVGVIGIPKELLHMLGELSTARPMAKTCSSTPTEMAHMAGIIARRSWRRCKNHQIRHPYARPWQSPDSQNGR